MSVHVKICGISSEEALEAAIAAGADYAGFVFYARSPRNVTVARGAELARRASGHMQTVAVTADATDDELATIVEAVRPAFLQLHGGETVERAEAIAERTGTSIIKAIKTASAADIHAARAFESVAVMMLFDAPAAVTPEGLPGGNGVAFDWALLRNAPLRRNFMLSGGLDPDNVMTALERSGAAAVDVSSGVERTRGVKSPELIRNFVARAKACALA